MFQRRISQESLSRLLVFSKLNTDLQRKIVTEMHERTVNAGEILINEGDTGLAATELYVVKSGKFEVSQGDTANDRHSR
jgi:cGMP-dependent protein kinase 2